MCPLSLQVTEISKVIGEMWGKASDKEKEKYQKKADEVREWTGCSLFEGLVVPQALDTTSTCTAHSHGGRMQHVMSA